jgi:GT2 family glycosyltransferase
VWSEITYVRTGRNLGFSGGVNVGIREALARGADAVLLVNSDVIVPPDCVGEMLRTFDADTTVGITGPLLRSRTVPIRIESAGITYNETTGRMRHLQGTAAGGITTSGRDRTVRAVSGCVMLIRRAVFEAIGCFDEDYFYSFEDIDFCLRARAAGVFTRLSSDATAYHQGSRSAAVSNVRTLYFAARNHLLMDSRLATGTTGLRKQLRPGIIVSLNVAHALFSSDQPARAGLRDVWAGCRDHLRSRYGNRPSEGV